MIAVKKVGEFYYEFWLEEGERRLMQRMFALPPTDNCIVVVTIIHKGLDTGALHGNFEEQGGDSQLDFTRSQDEGNYISKRGAAESPSEG